MPDGSECARPAHKRYASEHAGGNMHREVPEQPSKSPSVLEEPCVSILTSTHSQGEGEKERREKEIGSGEGGAASNG